MGRDWQIHGEDEQVLGIVPGMRTLIPAPMYHSFGNAYATGALLQRAEACGLLPVGVGRNAANAYREMRRAQHRARLDEKPTQFDERLLEAERDAVLALWSAVFPTA